MKAHRSTSLGIVARNCPAALDYYEAKTPADRDLFAVGIAAHAVIQCAGEQPGKDIAAIAEATVRELVTRGRAFEGEPEPPMSVDAATAGRDIALAYLARHPLPEGARFEAGLAVDADWREVDYRAGTVYYRAALDMIEVVRDADEDGYETVTVTVTDWKTAWSTDATELDTVQMRGQAAIAAAHYPEATVVRRRAVNLRTGAAYEADVVMDDDGRAKVDGWRRDIAHAIAAAEHRGPDGRRPHRPGAGCLRCAYVTRCPAALPLGLTPLDDVSALALELAKVEGRRAALVAALKSLADVVAIPVPGGIVGYKAMTERTVREDAHATIAHRWFRVAAPDEAAWDAANGQTLGLLAALDIGASQVEAIGKALYPADRKDKEKAWKTNREILDATCTGERTVSRFGVHALAETVNGDGSAK